MIEPTPRGPGLPFGWKLLCYAVAAVLLYLFVTLNAAHRQEQLSASSGARWSPSSLAGEIGR